MHFDRAAQAISTEASSGPWYKGLTRYHWFVLIVAALGWLFDTMDQQLFNLARPSAMRSLIPDPPAGSGADSQALAQARKDGDEMRKFYAGVSTTIFMLGWGAGGLAFGVLSDRIGRAKTMFITILVYSMFTGLSALSVGVWDFALYRFLTGLGVGGEFAAGVSLVAEVMPDRARPYALGLLQALSAVGNMTAALVGILIAFLIRSEVLTTGWRVMFLIGTLPALVCVPIFLKIDEPEKWRQARAAGSGVKLGSLSEMFSVPRWRRNAIVGMLLAVSGVVGLWGIGFFSFDLVASILRPRYEAQGLSAREIDFWITLWIGVTSLLQNAGGFFGVNAYTFMTDRIGRKPAFAISFVLALGMTAFTFWFLNSVSDIFWMIPLMGFCQLTLFGGYVIYFPELFPTRLRGTGTSFCYNVGRIAAAFGPLTLGTLASSVFSGLKYESFRYAGVVMCATFLVGLAALPFAPETKGQPLPE